jgi:hypothetical protein
MPTSLRNTARCLSPHRRLDGARASAAASSRGHGGGPWPATLAALPRQAWHRPGRLAESKLLLLLLPPPPLLLQLLLAHCDRKFRLLLLSLH